MNSANAIEIKDVSKVYKLFERPKDRLKESLSLTHKCYHTDHFALSGVNLNVKKGECVGIIGTNGSGKSTLLKIITGVLNASGGTVEIDGKISALLELGAGFNMEYTGIENIYLNGTMMGFTDEEIDAKLNDIIELCVNLFIGKSHHGTVEINILNSRIFHVKTGAKFQQCADFSIDLYRSAGRIQHPGNNL